MKRSMGETILVNDFGCEGILGRVVGRADGGHTESSLVKWCFFLFPVGLEESGDVLLSSKGGGEGYPSLY